MPSTEWLTVCASSRLHNAQARHAKLTTGAFEHVRRAIDPVRIGSGKCSVKLRKPDGEIRQKHRDQVSHKLSSPGRSNSRSCARTFSSMVGLS